MTSIEYIIKKHEIVRDLKRKGLVIENNQHNRVCSFENAKKYMNKEYSKNVEHISKDTPVYKNENNIVSFEVVIETEKTLTTIFYTMSMFV